jgi:hypothetical protein
MTEYDELISAVRLKIESGAATTHGPTFDDPADPISSDEFDCAAAPLDCNIPALVKNLYTRIGNGGFGPGHGLLNLRSLARADLSIPGLYGKLRSRNDQPWPNRILPFCDWGCGIFSCLDLREENKDPPVLRFEPNMSDSDTHEFLQGHEFIGIGLIPESHSFSSWLRDWLNDKEMFDKPYERPMQ